MDAVHPFRAMPTRDSDGCRRPVPGHADQLFRRDGVQFFRDAGIVGRLGLESVDSPHSHFRRRTSAILRMVNLSWAISASFVFPRQRMPQLGKVSQRRFLWDQFIPLDSGACRPLIPNQGDHRFRYPRKPGRHPVGTAGRHGPERVDGIHRNPWSA